MHAMVPDDTMYMRKSVTTMPQYRLRMREFLQECGLERKYVLKFKRQGVETVDDFMALDAADLALLDIDEDDLAAILILIQN